MKIIVEFAVCLLTHILDVIVFSKIINQKTKINIKIILFIIIFSLIDFFIGLNSVGVLKSIVTNIITFMLLKLIYKKTISKTIIGTVFVFLGYVIPELLVILIFYGALNVNESFILINPVGILLSNLSIFIFYLILINIKKITKLVNRIIEWYDDKKIVNTAINTLLVIVLCFTLLNNLSHDYVKNINDMATIMITIIGMIIFISGFFKEKSFNIKLEEDNDALVKYSKIYKDEVNSKGKLLHEYNNQLLMLKGMLKNKKINEANTFVNTLLDKYENTSENDWIFKLEKLPDSYINDYITLKIAEMNNEGITVVLEIDEDLKDDLIWTNAYKYIQEFTQILGVIFDNATQATKLLEEKQIIIEIKNNSDNIEFDVSNTYSPNIDFEIVFNEGYSSKGSDHGYGLSLVKDIINNNSVFTNEREINGKFYVQKVSIKK